MEYFVAVFGKEDNYIFHVFCHNTYRGAYLTAEDMSFNIPTPLLFVGFYEHPVLEIVHPVRGITRNNRWHGLAVRDHLMAGGSVSTSYGGKKYLFESNIFESPIALNAAGGPVDPYSEDMFEEAIGKCSIITEGVVVKEFYWEEMDRGHCVDHLMSQFFSTVAEIEFAGIRQSHAGLM